MFVFFFLLLSIFLLTVRPCLVDDIWISFQTATRIARELSLSRQLAGFLDPASRQAWSLDDGDQAGILHNWKIQEDVIRAEEYSMKAMLG